MVMANSAAKVTAKGVAKGAEARLFAAIRSEPSHVRPRRPMHWSAVRLLEALCRKRGVATPNAATLDRMTWYGVACLIDDVERGRYPSRVLVCGQCGGLTSGESDDAGERAAFDGGVCVRCGKK